MAKAVRAADPRGARQGAPAGTAAERATAPAGSDQASRGTCLATPATDAVSQTITLPFPPSVNHYWRHVVIGRSARTLISKRGREYREAVLAQCLVQRIAQLDGPLQCTVDLYPPDLRRRDCDNYAKGLLDALDHANAYGDDSQIIDLRIRMHAKHPPGMVVVTLAPTCAAHSPHAQIALVT